MPEGREGRLQFRGPSTTRGYYRNREATENLFDDDWLESGDLAYTRHGDIFITGRRKDLIIKAGRNIYAQEIERAVGAIEGVRMGCVAVFGVLDAAAGTEKHIVMAETRVKRSDRLQEHLSPLMLLVRRPMTSHWCRPKPCLKRLAEK